jgi:hypothetical protein
MSVHNFRLDAVIGLGDAPPCQFAGVGSAGIYTTLLLSIACAALSCDLASTVKRATKLKIQIFELYLLAGMSASAVAGFLYG